MPLYSIGVCRHLSVTAGSRFGGIWRAGVVTRRVRGRLSTQVTCFDSGETCWIDRIIIAAGLLGQQISNGLRNKPCMHKRLALYYLHWLRRWS